MLLKLFLINSTALLQIFTPNLESENFQYIKITNVGRKSAEELELFFNNVFTIVELIENEQDNLDIEFELFLLHCENLFKDNPKLIKEWLYLNKKKFLLKKFPIFSFLSLITQSKNIFTEKQLHIFKYYTGYYTAEKNLTLEEIGDNFNLTRERIRQLAKHQNLMEPFWKKIKPLLIPLKDKIDLNDYEIDTTSNLVVINQKQMSIKDPTNFSPEFAYKLFSILLEENFSLVFESTGSKAGEKYLVRRNIYDQIDIPNFLRQLSEIVNSKNDDSINVNLKGFIISHLKEGASWSIVEEIIPVCENIVFGEFGLVTDIDGNITIETNIKRPVFGYIIDILRKAGRPLHIEEIHRELLFLNSTLSKSADSTRSHILRNSNFFINTAWSTYGLKEWEENGSYIGGSIKDLAEVYLDKFDEPKHIYEIAQFVCKHRETNAWNIFSNLQNDPHNRFLMAGNGFVGLTRKEYCEEKLRFKGLSPAAFRGFKEKYFKNGKSIITYEDIIKQLSKIFDVKEIQIIASLHQRIDNGELILEDNYLLLR